MAEAHRFSIEIVTLERDHGSDEPGLQLNFATVDGRKGTFSLPLLLAEDFELEFISRRAEAIRQSNRQTE